MPVEVPRGTPSGIPSRSFERIKEQKECMFPNSDISTKLEAKLKHTKLRHVEESRMSKHDEDQVDVK